MAEGGSTEVSSFCRYCFSLQKQAFFLKATNTAHVFISAAKRLSLLENTPC